MSLGLEAAGFDIACSVEYDPVHSLVHHYNFPYGASICADVSSVSREDILAALASKGFDHDVDLVIGGPPCQGFSTIGKRQLDDSRNQLVFQFVRLIGELSPKFLIFENVPGLAHGKHRVFLDELTGRLGELGYEIRDPISVLNASHYGVPQNRRRVIVLGWRKGMPPLTYPEATNSQEASGGLAGIGPSTEHVIGSAEAISDLEACEVHIGADPGLSPTELNYEGYRRSMNPVPFGSLHLCHRRAVSRVYNHVGSKHTDVSVRRFRATPMGDTESVSRFYKLHPERPCNTLRAGTSSERGAYTAPRPIHYLFPRCISVREAARLHSFPDWFRFHNTVWHGFREIGNAVAPIFAKAIGDRVFEALSLTPDDVGIRDLPEQDSALLAYPMDQASKYWGVSSDVIPKRKRAA